MKYFFSVIIIITLIESGVFWYYNNLFSDQNSYIGCSTSKSESYYSKDQNLQYGANCK